MGNVFICEDDADGGFVEFLQKLWETIGPNVVILATELAAAALAGAVIGGVALSEFPLIGSIVGAIIGAAIGFIVGWITDSLKDDIFNSTDNPLLVILESPNSLFSGNKDRTPYFRQDFYLGDSLYTMTYYWLLVY